MRNGDRPPTRSHLKETTIFRCSSKRPAYIGNEASGLAELWPALFLAGVGIVALVAATLNVGDVTGEYLIFSAPWSGRAEMMDMVSRADGGVVGFGAVPFLAIAMAGRPDFTEAVRQQGAWLVLPSPVLLGCFGGATGDQP